MVVLLDDFRESVGGPRLQAKAIPESRALGSATRAINN